MNVTDEQRLHHPEGTDAPSINFQSSVLSAELFILNLLPLQLLSAKSTPLCGIIYMGSDGSPERCE